MSDFLEEIGIRVPALFAGLAGGIVGAWADSRVSWQQWLAYAICGGLTSNFLAEPATHVLPYVKEGGAGFIVGCTALIIVRTIAELVKRWKPALTGEQPHGD